MTIEKWIALYFLIFAVIGLVVCGKYGPEYNKDLATFPAKLAEHAFYAFIGVFWGVALGAGLALIVSGAVFAVMVLFR